MNIHGFFSSISQPHNPDVVIASDDEDEFADLQRGTVILKSVSIDQWYRKTKTLSVQFCLFCCFTSQVKTVSSPNHTFSWASLNKQLTSTSCTYIRL